MKNVSIIIMAAMFALNGEARGIPISGDVDLPLRILKHALSLDIGKYELTTKESLSMVEYTKDAYSYDAKLLAIYALAFSNIKESNERLKVLSVAHDMEIAAVARWSILLKLAMTKGKSECLGLIVNFIARESGSSARLFAINWLLCVYREKMPSLFLALYEAESDGIIKREIQQVLFALYPEDNDLEKIWNDINSIPGAISGEYGENWVVILGEITPRREINEFEMKLFHFNANTMKKPSAAPAASATTNSDK